MQAPNLLALQTESFDWLVGNEKWRARVSAANAARPGSLPETSGLEEIFSEISPIEDFGETMALSFHDHRFEEPKYTAEECQEKDLTYSAPLYVVADFENFSTGEIKSQTVFMGDFPLMTDIGALSVKMFCIWIVIGLVLYLLSSGQRKGLSREQKFIQALRILNSLNLLT